VKSTFRSLAVRNYRLYVGGQIVSNTGTWMQRIAQDWLVLQLTHGNGTAVGITTALQFLPMLLFSLWGGVLADRCRKRPLLMITQGSAGVLALLLGLLTVGGAVEVWHVYALAFGLGMVTAVDNPARQSFALEMVGREQLPNAVGLNSATFNLARLAGPAIAGVLIQWLSGTGPVFLLNAVSYGAVIVGLAMMRERELHATQTVRRGRGQVREGLAYVRGRPDLLLIMVVLGFVGAFGFNFQLSIALMATEVFHTGADAYGVLSSALAIGSFSGALLVARYGYARQRLVVGLSAAFGVFETLAGLMPSYLTFLVLLIPTGLTALAASTMANTTLQLRCDPSMRGRVVALYMLVFVGSTPLGAPLIGWCGEVLGPRYTLIVGGAVSALAAIMTTAVLAKRQGIVIRPHVRPRPHIDVHTAKT
jgi:MFS family permease